jgi:hypothetical protein
MTDLPEIIVASPHSPATLRRRKRLSRGWAILVIAWSFIRTLIVWAAVGKYGLNPWIYLSIDLASAITDAFTTPRMVLAFIDDKHRHAIRWGLISLGAFIVPDIYIFLGTRKLPKTVIVVVLVIILVTLAVAVVGVTKKIRKGRAERAKLASCARGDS